MKKPKKAIAVLSFGKKLLKGAVVAELVCFIGCYLFYRKTNRDPEFRYKLYIFGTPGYEILQAYYTLGQTKQILLVVQLNVLFILPGPKNKKCLKQSMKFICQHSRTNRLHLKGEIQTVVIFYNRY